MINSSLNSQEKPQVLSGLAPRQASLEVNHIIGVNGNVAS
ncbi:hypothetical protein HAL07_00780 [Helicobacter ailurogastricus]|uniref:Uncharacterized protein n=1 Tax=Helicobacter ailurogastricus TaxID=1578720 RepID=A0A0K2Y0V0_9HELI|nr:hypothetical protein HAL07_00780 [Helicobacter ailurogastricus]